MTDELTKVLINQARFEEMMTSQNRVLAEILDQAKKTNGRVGKHDEIIGGIQVEMAENRGKAKVAGSVSGAIWGVAGSIVVLIIGKLWK